MPKKCFVPNCTTGYDSNNGKIAIFKAPSNPKKLLQWSKAIPRKDRNLNSTSFVCEKHFFPSDIKRECVSADGLTKVWILGTT
jgi:hypothetical protein